MPLHHGAPSLRGIFCQQTSTLFIVSVFYHTHHVKHVNHSLRLNLQTSIIPCRCNSHANILQQTASRCGFSAPPRTRSDNDDKPTLSQSNLGLRSRDYITHKVDNSSTFSYGLTIRNHDQHNAEYSPKNLYDYISRGAQEVHWDYRRCRSEWKSSSRCLRSLRTILYSLTVPNATHVARRRTYGQLSPVDYVHALTSGPLHSIYTKMAAARHVQPLQLTFQRRNNCADANPGDPRGGQVQPS